MWFRICLLVVVAVVIVVVPGCGDTNYGLFNFAKDTKTVIENKVASPVRPTDTRDSDYPSGELAGLQGFLGYDIARN